MNPFEQYRMEISFPVLKPKLYKTLYRHANSSNLNYTPQLWYNDAVQRPATLNVLIGSQSMQFWRVRRTAKGDY